MILARASAMVVFALLAALSCTSARVPTGQTPFSSSGLPAEPVAVALQQYFRALRTVRLTSGTDTLVFLVDTGGGSTLLTVEAARALGCKPFGQSAGHRMTGERVDFQWCTGVPLALGGVPLPLAKVAVFDVMALLPPEFARLDGVLSLDAFEDRVVTIDLPGERLVLESAASAADRRDAMQPLVARRATGEDGSTLTVFLAARAQPAPVWLLLDSGNLAGTILSPHAVAQMGLGLPPSGGDESPAILEDVALQVIGLPPATHRVSVRDLIHDGVLGASFMEQRAVTFDFRSKEPWVGIER